LSVSLQNEEINQYSVSDRKMQTYAAKKSQIFVKAIAVLHHYLSNMFD